MILMRWGVAKPIWCLLLLAIVVQISACGRPADGDSGALASEDAVTREYNRSCIACHASGAAGAPRSFDTEAWQSRMSKGMEVLVQNTRNGYEAMPPMGFCSGCSDDDFKALIVYMAGAQ